VRDTTADSCNLRIVIHNDPETPVEFVVELMRTVLGRQEAEARALAAAIDRRGKAACGTWPSDVAQAMLATAQQRIKSAGWPLRITTAAISDADDDEAEASDLPRNSTFKFAYEAIVRHFSGRAPDEIVTTSRQFPGHMRADVQVALDRLFAASPVRFFGLYEPHRYETLTYARLTADGRDAVAIAAAQYQDVDIGEDDPIKCLNNGLWLGHHEDLPYALVLSFHREYRLESGACIEIAVPAGEPGVAFVLRCFRELEAAMNAARSYRGKVLSLDAEADYRGRSKGVLVHRLPHVARDAVILPEPTLKLLDRNVIRFIESRAALRRLGQSTRKGILLYGPPGTGKTHTIRYLAANLPGHTTLIITAGQMENTSAIALPSARTVVLRDRAALRQ
jgi:ATP-dependent Clp protease adapter protein ClpS